MTGRCHLRMLLLMSCYTAILTVRPDLLEVGNSASANRAAMDPKRGVKETPSHQEPNISSLAQVTIGSCHGKCPCIDEADVPFKRNKKGEVLLPFWEQNLGRSFTRPKDFGTSCKPWDKGTAPLCDKEQYKMVSGDGHANAGLPIKKTDEADCGKSWCFIYQACACGAAMGSTNGDAQMAVPDATLTMAKPEGGHNRPVYFTYMNCNGNAASAKKHKDDHCAQHPEDCAVETSKCESVDLGEESSALTRHTHCLVLLSSIAVVGLLF